MVRDLNQPIIDYLKVHHGFNSSAMISHQLNVSRKTIIRRINQLNESFPEDIIVSKRSQGFKLVYRSYLKYENTGSNDYSAANVRQKSILTKLLLAAPRSICISNLTNSLFVSESVIQNDEKCISTILKKWNLTLERKKRLLSIKGEEKDIRNAIIEEILQVNHTTDISNLRGSIGDLDNQDFDFALKQVKVAMKALNNNLPYPYNINFFTHIYILLSRARTFRSVDYTVEAKSGIESETNANPHIFAVCKQIISNIERYLNVKPNALVVETYYLFEYLISSRFSKSKSGILLNNQELTDKVSKVYIELVSSILQTKFNQNIEKDIRNHIFSMISRLKMKVSLPNALLNDIKLEYAEIYNATRTASNQIETKFNLPHISDSETGYICLYFVKYLEVKPKEDKKVNVYIICTTGIGTSEIISAKIKKLMPNLKVVGLGSNLEIEDIIQKHKNIDLLLSTVPLKVKENIPVELVSAFLTKEDEQNVKQAVRSIQNKR